MATIIDKMYADHRALHDLLTSLQETSLASDADNKLKKVLLVSAASYFEHEITTAIIDFVAAASESHQSVLSLVRAKAVSRQYHTYFQWDGKNANSFFGLFGEEFLAECKAHVKTQEALDDSIRAFLEIGSNRNQMMHEKLRNVSNGKDSRGGIRALQKSASICRLYSQAVRKLIKAK